MLDNVSAQIDLEMTHAMTDMRNENCECWDGLMVMKGQATLFPCCGELFHIGI